jgi:3-methylcrotonyl-CoA carboxylase alpha subunit
VLVNGEWVIEMEFNYEHNNQFYKITVEKMRDSYEISYEHTTYTIYASEIKPGHLKIEMGDNIIKAVISEGKESKYVFLNGQVYAIRHALPKTKKIERKDELVSPISGTVVKVPVKEGDKVQKGDIIMVIEAMKMEYLIKAPFTGAINKIYFKIGDQIDMGVKPVDIKKEEE